MSECHATRERLAAEARFDRLHSKLPYHDGTRRNWAKDPSEDAPYHYKAGVTIWVAKADFKQGGDFLQQGGDEPDED